MKTCALLPAAGRGSRLGLEVPKIFAPLDANHTVWDVLYSQLHGLVDQLHLVLSPHGLEYWRAQISPRADVSAGIQETPRGMGDSVFCCEPDWQSFDRLLVVWGDQVSLSRQTVARVLDAHRGGLTLPLVEVEQPYVQYDLDGERLLRVRESREGDVCDPRGRSDVGVFLLDCANLSGHWRAYLSQMAPGKQTGEINFLPFLPYLSSQGWPVTVVEIESEGQRRGLNTPQDLDYFRQDHSERRH